MNNRPRSLIRFFGFLLGGGLVVSATFLGCSLYERATYRAYRLGINSSPLFTSYYLGRLALISLVSLLLIGGLYRLRDRAASIQQTALSSGKRAFVGTILIATTVIVSLFLVAPSVFHAMALEDGPVEWASALLPLAASMALFHASFRIRRAHHSAQRSLTLVLTLLFAFALFVIGMEEISWGQRLFGLETPALFSANEQNEINLHNMYTLLFNLGYRTIAFAGLIVLPLVVETAPKNRLFDRIDDFLPGRFVVAASAPLVGFDYGVWNFFLGPLQLAIALVILLCYALAARTRGDRAEMALFGALAILGVVSQTIFLAFPESADSTRIPEYRELLQAIGLAVFATEVAARLRARYGRREEPAMSYPTDIGGPRTA